MQFLKGNVSNNQQQDALSLNNIFILGGFQFNKTETSAFSSDFDKMVSYIKLDLIIIL